LISLLKILLPSTQTLLPESREVEGQDKVKTKIEGLQISEFFAPGSAIVISTLEADD
jgi:hypothetical protein